MWKRYYTNQLFLNISFVGRSPFQFLNPIINSGDDVHGKGESQHCCHLKWMIINFFHNVLWYLQKVIFHFNRKTLRKTGNTCLRSRLETQRQFSILLKKLVLPVAICLHSRMKYTTRAMLGYTSSPPVKLHTEHSISTTELVRISESFWGIPADLSQLCTGFLYLTVW